MVSEFNIAFGAIAEPIAEQVRSQGFQADADAMDRFQRDADALVHLAVRDLIPESVVTKARQKLMRRLSTAVLK